MKKRTVFDTSSQVTKKKAVRDITAEPEMIELKRMIREGELDAARTVATMKGKEAMKTKPKDNMKQLVARIPEEVHRALKIRAAEDGQSVAVIVEGLIRQYLVWKDEVGKAKGGRP